MRFSSIPKTGSTWLLSTVLGLFLTLLGVGYVEIWHSNETKGSPFMTFHSALFMALVLILEHFLHVLVAAVIAAPTITICNVLLKGRWQVGARVILGAVIAVGLVFFSGVKLAPAPLLAIAIPLGGAAGATSTGEPALMRGRFWLVTFIGSVLSVTLWTLTGPNRMM